jgi:recombination protein RecT
MAETKAIAIRDADIVSSINHWGESNLSLFYQGRNFDAWKQDAALAVVENPDLRAAMTTDAGKLSLVRALQRSASSGLSLNPQRGESALVYFNDKVNFWPMKTGLISKALETGSLEFIEANAIYSGDSFSIKKTAKGDDYEFTPALKDRGVPVAYFAVAVLKSGRSVVEYWAREQVEKHKAKYGKGLSKQGSAWNTNFDGMAEKTVLKALINGLHLPKAVTDLIEMDNAAENEQYTDRTEPADKTLAAEMEAAEEKQEKLAEQAAAADEEPVDVTLGKPAKNPLF